MTFPPPAFKPGDTVCRNSGVTGVVTEVRHWESGRVAYRVLGRGFPPRHYFAESVLSAGRGEVINFLR